MAGVGNGEGMHRHVRWMVAADVLILDYLYSSRTPQGAHSVQTPNTIAINTGYSNRHTSARCQVLADRGLIERVGKGRYRLDELGARVVENEISIGELNDLTADGGGNTEE